MTASTPDHGTHRPAPDVLLRLDAWIGRHARVTAGVLYVLALALRVRHLLAYRDSLLAQVSLMDEAYYHAEAWNLVRGVPQASDSWFMTPLYPYFLSLIFRVAGDSTTAVYLVQMILGASAAPLAFVLARRLVPNLGAIVAGLAVASFAPVVFFESLMLVEWLVLVAWLAAATAAVRLPQGRIHALAAGAFLGLATLGRGSNALLLVPFVLWFAWRNRGRVAQRFTARPAVRQAMRVVAGWTCVMLPLFLYNVTHAEQPVLLTANAGFNLYVGNGPGATGIFRLPDGIDLAADPLALRYAQRQIGRRVTASEASRFWARETWSWVNDHPLGTLQLFLWKLALFWNRFPIPQVESFATVAPLFPLGHAPYWSHYAIFPLGLIGMLLALARALRRGAGRDHASLFVAAGIAVFAGSIALFFITDRYRIAAMPHLIVLSVYTLLGVAQFLWSGRRVAALGVVLAATIAFLLTDPGRLRVDLERVDRDLAVHDALRLAKAGAFDAAIETYGRALRSAPEDADLRDGIARLYARAGRDTLAIAILEELVHDPDLRDEAQLARSWYNLGNVYRRSGRNRDAVVAYQRALALDDRRESAWNNLGEAYRALGDTLAAADAYRRAIAIVPGHEQALNNLGALRASQGDARDAEARFRAAVAANPRYVPAWTNLALLLTGGERYREALEAWRMILVLEPDNALARQALDAAAEAGLVETENP